MTDIASQSTQPRRRGSPARPIVEFPEATSVDWIDPPAFHDALRLHLARHGDTYWHLHRSIIRPGERFDRKTLQSWGGGTKVPHTAVSMRMLERIEDRYRLPRGYFADKLPKAGRAIRQSVPGVSAAERRRLAWPLPDDFEERPREEQEEILDWVRTTIITGSTDYRRYQSEATRIRFSLQFPDLRLVQLGWRMAVSVSSRRPLASCWNSSLTDPDAVLFAVGGRSGRRQTDAATGG